MTEEQVKNQYREIRVPQHLRGRVLSACAAARKKRRGSQHKRFASLAACLAGVLCLSAYGLSPAPVVVSGGQTVERGGAAVAAGMADLCGGMQPRVAAAVSLEPPRGAATGNPETGGVAEAGRTCRVAAAERLYWQIPGSQAVLTVRAGLRAIRIEAIRNDSGWFLSR